MFLVYFQGEILQSAQALSYTTAEAEEVTYITYITVIVSDQVLSYITAEAEEVTYIIYITILLVTRSYILPQRQKR